MQSIARMIKCGFAYRQTRIGSGKPKLTMERQSDEIQFTKRSDQMGRCFRCGTLAGDVGPGRMLEPLQLVDAVIGVLATPAQQPLQGVKVTITAGPTREAIDPVRYISNHSSGKMGYALAQADIIKARKAGFEGGQARGDAHIGHSLSCGEGEGASRRRTFGTSSKSAASQ